MIKEWLMGTGGNQALVFPPDKLEGLLSQTEVIEDVDSFLCDRIRILKWQTHILVQEINWDKQGVLHLLDSLEAAKAKVKDRVDTYERMWDGCGCKVDHRL